jgi:putative transposase
MKRGFVYLFAVLDWASRRVLSWRISNTLTTDFCIEEVQEAIHRYGTPDIFNTDQGSQFTRVEFTQLLKNNGIAISMDGKGLEHCSDGATMCSSSDCGNRSSTRKCTCTLTRR